MTTSPLCRVLCLLLILAGALVARAETIEDQRTALAKATDEEERITRMINLSYALLGEDPTEAAQIAKDAAARAEQRGDRTSVAEANLNLSNALTRLGRHEDAVAAAERSVAAYRAVKDRSGEATALLNLGNAFLTRGAAKEASAHYEQSLALLDVQKEPGKAAMACQNLASCWLYLGDATKADALQRRALDLYRRSGDAGGAAALLLNLGATAYSEGRYDDASARLLETLAETERLGDKRLTANASHVLGLVAFDQGRTADAERFFQRCADLSREISDRGRLALGLMGLATVRNRQERFAEARALLEEALRLGRETSDARLVGNVLTNLGMTLNHLKENPAAIERLREAETTLEKAGDPNLRALAAVVLSKTLRDAGDPAGALAAARRALALGEKSGSKKTLRDANREVSLSAEAAGDLPAALLHARRFRDLDKELLNEETSRQIVDAEKRYEGEKKARQIEVLERDRRIQEAALDRQRLLRNGALFGAGGLLLLAGVALNAWRVQRRDARVIAAERAKSDRLLHSILPDPIAERLKAQETTIADSFAEVTVLFADIVGFTQFSQSVSAEELVRLLDKIFTRFDALAEKHGVEKIKTIGDCYMAVAGLPEPAGDHCERIARLAIDLRGALEEFNTEEGQRVKVRIGFHTGSVVAGVIGRQKFIYDLWGDTVNTASRMESSGQADRIQVSEAAARELDGQFAFEPRGEIEVKGKGRMRTFFLSALGAPPREASQAA